LRTDPDLLFFRILISTYIAQKQNSFLNFEFTLCAFDSPTGVQKPSSADPSCGERQA